MPHRKVITRFKSKWEEIECGDCGESGFLAMILILGLAYILLAYSMSQVEADVVPNQSIEIYQESTKTISITLEKPIDIVIEPSYTSVVVSRLESEISRLSSDISNVIEEKKQFDEEIARLEYRELWYRNVALDDEYQMYLYEMCVELNLDYNLSLAKMSLESNFDIDARNVDTNGSVDIGISQINSVNVTWISELADRSLDVYSVKDNILGGLLIYKHYKDYWANKGYIGNELTIRALNSYNFGIGGYNKYMAKGNLYDSWKYAKAVFSRLDGIE